MAPQPSSRVIQQSDSAASPMTELQILSPDGQNRQFPLQGERISVGRAATAELSFPDDNGLSRQHLAIERDGEGWSVRDLGSKNGTVLNGVRVTEKTRLNPGDRITAGHLILIYDTAGAKAAKPVVLFDALDPGTADTGATIIYIHYPESRDAAAALAVNQVSALIRAGNELAGNRPLQELFPFILDLSIQAVNADRGVLLTLEDGELVVRFNRGDGFHISTAVARPGSQYRRIRSGSATPPLTMRCARGSIWKQNTRTLMAVPLQTRDQIIGIIYVDSPSLSREFTRDDLNLLTVMANVAANRIER